MTENSHAGALVCWEIQIGSATISTPGVHHQHGVEQRHHGEGHGRAAPARPVPRSLCGDRRPPSERQEGQARDGEQRAGADQEPEVDRTGCPGAAPTPPAPAPRDDAEVRGGAHDRTWREPDPPAESDRRSARRMRRRSRTSTASTSALTDQQPDEVADERIAADGQTQQAQHDHGDVARPVARLPAARPARPSAFRPPHQWSAPGRLVSGDADSAGEVQHATDIRMPCAVVLARLTRQRAS